MALVRGDMQVNETKLNNALRARWLRPAEVDAIREAGAEPGYASPINVRREAVTVVADELVASSPNMVSGANEAGFHYRNVNVGRDYQADIVTDITATFEGAGCPECGGPLRLSRGVEVGNIFQLGTRYTEALGATYLDAEGQSRPVVMGSYGIGVGRMLACAAEAFHDERGLRLPVTIAPYEVYFVRLTGGDAALDEQADGLYDTLRWAGIEVLYDDREAAAGVKFNDADLLGIPLRVTLSGRSLKNGGVELKRRDSSESAIVPVDAVLDAIKEILAGLHKEVAERVRDIPYPESEAVP
jgi:prolyl-tRNA synthetase